MGLTDAEASTLGPVLKRLSSALQSATGAERIYILSLVDRLSHWHLSLTARGATVPDDQRGLAFLRAHQAGATADPAASRAVASRVRLALGDASPQ
jgi:hypothetical protein